FFQGGDEHDRVAAAEVIDHVVLRDLGNFAHAIDDVLRRGHPAHDDVVFDLGRLAEVGDELAAVFHGQLFLSRDLGVVVRLPGGGYFDGLLGGADLVGAFGAAAADRLAVDDNRRVLLRNEDLDRDGLLVAAHDVGAGGLG